MHVLAPHRTGGLETVARRLVTGLVRDGVDCRVAVTLGADAEGLAWFEAVRAAGVPCHHVLLTRNPLRDALELRRHLDEVRPTIVHSHGYRADIVSFLATRARGVRLVSTAHGFAAVDWKTRLNGHLDRRTLRRFDAVLAVAPTIRDVLVADGVPAGRIHVVHNGLDIEVPAGSHADFRARLGLRPADEVVGTVGRLSAEKAHADLLRAVAMVGQHRPSAVLVMVGDGPLRGSLEELTRELHLEARVRFLGEREDVHEILRAFDLFALPSRTEGCPIVLIEAMAHGLPIVATRVGAIPEMTRDGEEARLVEPGEPAALARAIESLLDDSATRARLGQAAQARYAARFRESAWLERVRAVYAAVSGG